MSKRKKATKEITVARQIVRTALDLKEKVNHDLLSAYQVIFDTMTDPNASQATKRACANDIITLYIKFHKDSLEDLEEFDENDPALSDGEGGKQSALPAGQIVRFSFDKR
jgi:hypothetical protein